MTVSETLERAWPLVTGVRPHGVHMYAQPLGFQTDAQGWEHHAWWVRLTRRFPDGSRRQFTLTYRMGVGHGTTAPTLLEVLGSVFSDAGMVWEHADAEDMGEALGMLSRGDAESVREVRRIWAACKREDAALGRLFTPGERSAVALLLQEEGY